MHTGLDIGLNLTALVTLDDDGQMLHKVHFGSRINDPLKAAIRFHPSERYRMYYDRLINYFTTNSITGTIVMEDPFGTMVGNGRKVVELKGVYLVALSVVASPHNIFLPTPSEIKKFFTEYGAATKEQMIAEAKKRGYEPRHDHEADAIAMALMSVEGKL